MLDIANAILYNLPEHKLWAKAARKWRLNPTGPFSGMRAVFYLPDKRYEVIKFAKLVEAGGGVRWKWERYPVFRPDPTMPTMPDTIHVKPATNPFDGFSGK